MDILGGLEKEHTTLYLEKRVRLLLKKESEGSRKRMSEIANEILWEGLRRRYA